MGRIGTFSGLVVVISFIAAGAAINAAGYEFRNTYWGMTISQVKQSESGSPIYEESLSSVYDYILAYEGYVQGIPATIGYLFKDNQLIEAGFRLKTIRGNKNLYINDFNDIKKSIIPIHGKSTKSYMKWSDSTYKNDPANYGTAVAEGHLKLHEVWVNPKTEIVLTMKSGKNSNDLVFGATYRSAVLKPEPDSYTLSGR